MLCRMTAEGFLASLSVEEADAFRAAGFRRTYGANITLLHQADEAGSVMVLLRGRAKIAVIGSGREAIFGVVGPGDLVGELAALDNSPRSTTVTTLERVDALVVSRSDFLDLLDRHPRIALVILRMVARRLRYADAQRTQFATLDVAGRLAQRLLELCERFGTEHERGIEISLPLSQEELANWAGASREAVSKAFQLLRTLQIVETGRRRVTVLDLAALQRHAHWLADASPGPTSGGPTDTDGPR
jgi:CRP/FNR family transcriptional regulator, cyclic AMP receptor protein